MKSNDVFFCERSPAAFHEIILNKDLEKLLEVDTILVENKSIHKPNISINKAERESITVLSPTQDLPKIVPDNKCEDDSKKSVSNIKRICTKDDISKLRSILCRNEAFVCRLATSNHHSQSLNDGVLHTLDNFLINSAPLNRFSWKVMQKLNIAASKFPQQFLKIRGHDILLSGNLGGNIKDLEFKTTVKKKKNNKKPEVTAKKKIKKFSKPPQKRMLLSHINYNLKPGPLSKKPLLNRCTQMGLGDIQLIKLPRVKLEISPSVGIPLDINICKCLKHVRDSDGFIDALWANFATSVVQSQMTEESKASHSFIIPYENNRSRVLMRKDLDATLKSNLLKRKRENSSYSLIDTKLSFLDNFKPRDKIEKTTSEIMSDLLRCICIEEIQDDVLNYDPINEFIEKNDILSENSNSSKKKCTRKKYVNELRKLDVTVIELDLDQGEKLNNDCNKDICKLGCICSSLETNYRINNHCGLPECMFDCKCNLDENAVIELCRPEEMVDISQSAVANLQHQMNRHLSKEEKKFQRTVIRSNNQTILLGAKRRGVRLPKRFEDYCNDTFDEKGIDEIMPEVNSNPIVLLPKLPEAVNGSEPWCMVHNLYRCFCKGMFLQGTQFSYSNIHNEKACSSILNDTISISRNNSFNVIHDITCARTTHHPALCERNKKKLINFSLRNEKIRFHEDKNVDKKKLLLRKIHACATNLNIESSTSGHMNQTQNIEDTCDKIDNSNSNQHQDEVHDHDILKAIDKKNSPTSKQKESERYMDIIKKNIPLVTHVIKSKTSMPIKIPKENDFAAISLHSMISDYLLEEIFIWITTQPPYKQYITLNDFINCPIACVNIHLAHYNIIQQHPPFIKEIASLSLSNETFVLLVGKPFAWEIAATMKSVIKDNDTESKALPNPTIEKSVSSDETNKCVLKVKRVEKRICELTNLQKKSSWFMLFIGDDFDMIKVENKHFTITRSAILKAIEGAQVRNRFIRFLSKDLPLDERPHFGLYASPYLQEKCAFLGPYENSATPDIEVIGHNPDAKQSSGMWLNTTTHHRLHNILSFLSAQKNKNVNLELAVSPKFPVLPEISLSKSQTSFGSVLNVSSLKTDDPHNILFVNDKSKSNLSNFSKNKRHSSISLTEPMVKLPQIEAQIKLIKKDKILLSSSPNISEVLEETDIKLQTFHNSVQNTCDEDVIFMPNEQDVVEISDSE